MLVKVVDLELSVMRELQLPDAELVPFRVEAVTDADEALRNMILRRLMRRLAAADAGPHAGLFPRIERARDRHK